MRIPTSRSCASLAVLICAFVGSPALGLPQGEDEPAGSAVVAEEMTTEDATEAGPEAQPLDVEEAVEGYLARLSPEQKARSDAYMEGGYWLQLWGFLWGVGVALVLLFTRLSARLRDLAERVAPWSWLRPAVYGLQYAVVTAVLSFPLAVYQGFFREHRYGLSNQTFPEWLRDQAVGLLVGTIFTALFLLLLYAVFRKAPRTWWLWSAGVTVVMFAFVMLVYPVYVAPLFNDYKPVEDPQIREPVLSLARANGVPADNVWQFDASRQSTRINANVSGIGGTMRISLNDNLLERGTREEIEAVMAHEIAHYVLNHIYKGMLFIAFVALLGFGFVRLTFGRLVERHGERWRVRGLADPAGWPLLVLLFSVFVFVLTPFLNTFIRSTETEADLFALNASRQPDAFASMAVKLAEYRKLDPAPWEEWIFYDHPSGRSRIEMAMRWKAENPDPEGDR